jgi:hypothetical protein
MSCVLTALAHPQTGALQNKRQTNCPTSAPCSKDGCACPLDNYLDTGVLINEFKGYQCAYPGGACLWDNVRHCVACAAIETDEARGRRPAISLPS